MWDFGNRGVVVLISVTCGCVLVYNAWGAILALAFTLLLVVYACYSLLANDSLISPHAYHVFGYLREAVHELGAAIRVVYGYGTGFVRKLWHSANRCYREHFPPFRMDRRRTGNYQLSSDSYAAAAIKRGESSTSSSRFGMIDHLSPIPCVPYRSRVNDMLGTDSRLYHVGDYDCTSQQQPVYGKHTSTPVLRSISREENSRNGDVNQMRGISTKKMSPMYAQNHTLSRGENVTQFSPEGSPWGMSISPKMRPRPAGIKTVQTVAGPLLASTRYNIDPKVYTDVSSPGLTTRLTKYATEAKTKLIHQSQYGTGQFPKVNLYANPIPMLNAKLTKMRMPVTVRVAPPDITKYSPPEKQKILASICHTENRSPTSVVQVLREISLKRHASTEDVSFDVAKKQRTEYFNEERETILEENKQKRSRDDSSKSDEDLSPQNKVRPAKRTKTRSCYDIINSLSSSAHVAAGVKRKAVDTSHSDTPNFEKHFKSLESTQSNDSPTASLSQNFDTDIGTSDLKEIYSNKPDTLKSKKAEELSLGKGILKSSNKEVKLSLDKHVTYKNAKSTNETDNTKAAVPTKPIKLTDKLFMRAEPERNEQLKLLVEEPSVIRVKFATDNVEEIKKEDIRNMRQTSMKARLQSMFDAISGKAENKINPDVVIQADDVNTVTPPVTLPVSCATLNSSTTTTNVNTTPLSTAAIIPSGFSLSRPSAKVETKSDATFSCSPKTSPAQPNVLTNILAKEKTNLIAKTIETTKQTNVSIAPTITSTAKSSEKVVPSIPSTVAPTFNFGKPAAETLAMTSNSTLPNFGASTYSSNTFTPTSSKSTNFLIVDKAPSSSTFAPINPSTITREKIEINNIVTTSAVISSSTTENTQTTSIFTFGNKPTSSPVTQAAIPTLPRQSPGTLLPISTTTVTSNTSFNSVVNSSTSNSTPLFTLGGSNTTSQSPKSNNFIFGQSSSNVQSKMNAFGSSVNTQVTPLSQVTKSFNFTSNPSTTIVANSSFTTNATTATVPTFGLSSASTFSLGTTSATSSMSTLPISKSLFVFGASNSPSTTSTAIALPAIALPATALPATALPATALPAATANNTTSLSTISSNAISTFGASTATTVSQFGASTTTFPQFGTPTTNVSQFSTPTTSIFATVSIPTTSTIFGTGSNSQPLFGTASGSGATSETASIFNTTTAPPLFVPTTIVASSSNSTPSAPSLFSNTNANSTPITTTPSVFSSGTSIFGQTKSPTSFGTTSSMFGGTTVPMFGSTTQTGTTVPAFGITSGNVSTTAITSGFDTASNTTPAPAFGTPDVGTTTSVQASPAFGGTTGGIFGSTDNNAPSVPIFGGVNATPATEAFGIPAATSTFGTQSPPSLPFGASSGSTTFGDNKSLFGATPTTSSNFGTSNPSVPAFGASNANNASTNNMFVFGSAQKDGQQNTTFSFGSNFNAASNNSTGAPSVPFQFGAPTAKPATTAFNFTASPASPALNFGTTAAPTFNPSTPGMFSIGSGSTAPRSRTIRTRKPR